MSGDWIPYSGPDGGEGWENTDTGEKVYTDEPPGGLDTDMIPEAARDKVAGVLADRGLDPNSYLPGDHETPEPDDEGGSAIGADVDDMSVNVMGNMIADELGESETKRIFDNARGEGVIRDYAEMLADDDSEVRHGINPEDIEVGATVLTPETGAAEITGVVNDPMTQMGPNAGYLETDSGPLVMGGDTFAEDVGLPPEEISDLSKGRMVVDADDVDPDAWDPSDLDMSQLEEDQVSNSLRDETAVQLSATERDALWDGIGEVTRDGARRLRDLTESAKDSSYSVEGQIRERAFLRGNGLADENYRNDTIEGGDPDEELEAAAAKFTEASREIFREVHGESAEVHRGLSDTATAGILEEIANGADDIEVETFGMTNYSTEPGVAEKFGSTSVVISRDVDADDVLSYTDAAVEYNQEGEISIEGGKQTIERSDIKMRNSDGDFVPIDEALEDPHHQTELAIRSSTPDEVWEAVL